MSRLSRRAFAVIACFLVLTVTASAVPPDMAMYVGGTIPALTPKAEGRLSTSSPVALTFEAKGAATVSIPYASITAIEYGQKRGRRAGMAILLSPFALFVKKRHHYLTLRYTDASAERVAEFELGKNLVRGTLRVLQVRTGKDIVYRDENACRSVGGPGCGGRP